MGAPKARGPLGVALTPTTVRYATAQKHQRLEAMHKVASFEYAAMRLTQKGQPTQNVPLTYPRKEFDPRKITHAKLSVKRTHDPRKFTHDPRKVTHVPRPTTHDPRSFSNPRDPRNPRNLAHSNETKGVFFWALSENDKIKCFSRFLLVVHGTVGTRSVGRPMARKLQNINFTEQ